jgi:hypothetical protein
MEMSRFSRRPSGEDITAVLVLLLRWLVAVLVDQLIG